MKLSISHLGDPKVTWQQTSTNYAASLTSENLVNALGQKAVAVFITIENNDVRITFDGISDDPNTSGFGHPFQAGSTLLINDSEIIRKLRFVSKTASKHAVLHITSFFVVV